MILKKLVRLYLLLFFFSAPSLTAYAIVRTITFPVDGESSFRDDFAEPRGGGTREHLGIDIIAPKMTPVVAAADGVISYIVSPEASWGYSITVRDDEGYQYRYLHLNNDTPGTDDGAGGETNAYAPGMEREVRVVEGQHIGWVGDSGNAESTDSHLHFEIRDPERTPINPYESLIAARPEAADTAATGTAPRQSGAVAGATGENRYVFTQRLTTGSRGEEVRQLQMHLAALGYFDESPTGYFGPVTKNAVVSFQLAEGIDPLGIVGPNTLAELNAEETSRYLFTRELAEGARGEGVRRLQIALRSRGYFSESPTGYFGPITKKAVVNFQKDRGIDPIGIVGPKTQAALNST